MAHGQLGLEWMSKVVVASEKELEPLAAAHKLWKEGPSRRNNIRKMLMELVDLGHLEFRQKFFCFSGYRGDYGPHARDLTAHLCRVLAKYKNTTIRREVYIENENIKRRADALLLIRDGARATCIVFECTVSESQASFNQKAAEWYAWGGALEFLTFQFGTPIPRFSVLDSAGLNRFLEG